MSITWKHILGGALGTVASVCAVKGTERAIDKRLPSKVNKIDCPPVTIFNNHERLAKMLYKDLYIGRMGLDTPYTLLEIMKVAMNGFSFTEILGEGVGDLNLMSSYNGVHLEIWSQPVDGGKSFIIQFFINNASVKDSEALACYQEMIRQINEEANNE